MRADAAANRETIIAAAMGLFVDVGLSVSLRSVAAQAGVGIGTLYRHFPDRDALLRGVVEHIYSQVSDVVDRFEAVEATEDTWRAYVTALVRIRAGRLLPQVADDSGLLSPGSWGWDFRESALLRFDAALARAKAAGLVRDDVDVARLQIGIAQLSRPMGTAVDELVPGWEDWLVDVFLRGLRP